MHSFILTWLADTILGSMVGMATEYIFPQFLALFQQFLARSGDKYAFSDLQRSVQDAFTVLKKIMSMHIGDESSKKRLRELMFQLKDAICAAYKLEDEFKLRARQQQTQTEQQGYQASNSQSSPSSSHSDSPPSKNIISSAVSSVADRLFWGGRGGSGDHDDDVVSKMREIKGMIDKITTDIKEVTGFMDGDADGRKQISSSERSPIASSSSVEITQIVGQDMEKRGRVIGRTVLARARAISRLMNKINSGERDKNLPLPNDSMPRSQSVESGNFWLPVQIYNPQGVVLSCFDAEVRYDNHTDTFLARFPPYGQKTTVMEEGVRWDRIRVPPVDTPAHDLHISDCLNDLQPGDHFEVQWKRHRGDLYSWWYGVIGHLEACDGSEQSCRCHQSDTVVLEFKQYEPGTQWRRASIDRKNLGEQGSESVGFYGGIRKLQKDEISKWRLFWPAGCPSGDCSVRVSTADPRGTHIIMQSVDRDARTDHDPSMQQQMQSEQQGHQASNKRSSASNSSHSDFPPSKKMKTTVQSSAAGHLCGGGDGGGGRCFQEQQERDQHSGDRDNNPPLPSDLVCSRQEYINPNTGRRLKLAPAVPPHPAPWCIHPASLPPLPAEGEAHYPAGTENVRLIPVTIHLRDGVPEDDTPAHDLNNSDCLNDLRPGVHFEVQRKEIKQDPFEPWYGIVGHSERCDGSEQSCKCHQSDTVVLEFNEFPPGSRWRRALIDRKNLREQGNEIDGYYGTITKLSYQR